MSYIFGSSKQNQHYVEELIQKLDKVALNLHMLKDKGIDWKSRNKLIHEGLEEIENIKDKIEKNHVNDT